MVARSSSLALKAASVTSSVPQASSLSLKAAIAASALPNVSSSFIKIAVRRYPIRQIVKITPPVPLTFICSCNPVPLFEYGRRQY